MKAALWGYLFAWQQRTRGWMTQKRGLGIINDSLTAQSRSPSPQAAQLPCQSDRSRMRHGAASHRPPPARPGLPDCLAGVYTGAGWESGTTERRGCMVLKLLRFQRICVCTFPGNGKIDRNNTARRRASDVDTTVRHREAPTGARPGADRDTARRDMDEFGRVPDRTPSAPPALCLWPPRSSGSTGPQLTASLVVVHFSLPFSTAL